MDRLVHDHGLVEILPANVDVGRSSPHRIARDQATFDELMRVLAHNLAIFTSTRLALVGIDHEELGPSIAILGHEGPLQARREARAAAAS